MRLLRSQNWAGIGVVASIVLTVVGFFVAPWASSLFSEKAVDLRLLNIRNNVVRFTPDESKVLLRDPFKFSAIVEANYNFINAGSRALTPSDYLNPITVSYDTKIKVFSVTSRLSTDPKTLIPWKEVTSGVWQMPEIYLNPDEWLGVSVMVGVEGTPGYTMKDLSSFIHWAGRFKEIKYPETVIADVAPKSNFFMVWSVPPVMSFMDGWRFASYLSVAVISYAVLAWLCLRWGYHKIPSLWIALNLLFVVMSFCLADSINPSSLPREVYKGHHWANALMPMAVPLVIFALYSLRKKIP